jgi:hypothetical protein
MVFLLIVQALLLSSLSWSTSPNRTEIGHLGALVYFGHTGKFDVFHVNPPLVRMIAGLPMLCFVTQNTIGAVIPRVRKIVVNGDWVTLLLPRTL